MMTKEEMLELAKKCGAALLYPGEDSTYILSVSQLAAYTSAIEEKYQARIQELEMQSRGNWIDAEQQAQKVTELQAQIAELLAYVKEIVESEFELSTRGQNRLLDKGARLLSDTQATSDAFIAEVKARAAGEWKKDAERYRWLRGEHQGYENLQYDADGILLPREPKAIAWTVFRPNDTDECLEPVSCVPGTLDEEIDKAMAAEFCNQQLPQPRKPCTCDGWCDGLCLDKEGKRK